MKSKKLAYALAISMVSLLTGCGSSGNGNNNPVSPGNIIGCAQYSGSTCIQPIYGTAGGCVPISSPIYFAGSGQVLGNVLAAGAIPNYGSYGALSVSSSPISNVNGQTWTSTSGLSINIANNSAGTQTSVSGSLTLSQAAQYNIQMTSQSSYPYSGAWGSSFYGSTYGTGYGSSNCVSGLALQLAPYSSVNGVYGYAYLYLNGSTQHGYILQLY